MSSKSLLHGTVVLVLLHFMLFLTAECQKNITAMFVFGDSTVDSGNNNFLLTTSRSNYPPYGKDFPGKVPTGRFTNGKLVTDFIASYLGIKEFIPPYLDPSLKLDDLKTGVCFASASTGFDPLTATISSVLSMDAQLGYFKEYISRMEGYIGKAKTQVLLKRAAVLISAGSNDFIANFFPLPIRNITYTLDAYKKFILQQEINFIQALLKLGARNIIVVGFPPLGCIPAVIIVESGFTSTQRTCLEWMSNVARDYSRQLQAKLASFQTYKANILYIDIFNPINEMIKRPQHYGFNVVNRGCCGGQVVGLPLPCSLGAATCSDVSKYVFWDNVHPTQAVYYKLFQGFIPTIDRFRSRLVI